MNTKQWDHKIILEEMFEIIVSKPNFTDIYNIYNPITAMGFSAMFTFQLDNTKR